MTAESAEDKVWPWMALLCGSPKSPCDQVGYVRAKTKRDAVELASHWCSRTGGSAPVFHAGVLVGRVGPDSDFYAKVPKPRKIRA